MLRRAKLGSQPSGAESGRMRTLTSSQLSPPPRKTPRAGDYVLIVAADGEAHVALVGEGLVGGIEADPAKAGEAAFNPGMGRGRG